jgi:hypothetical protein
LLQFKEDSYVFAGMKKTIKQTYFLIIALSLTVILADGGFITNVFFHNQAIACDGCTDFSDNIHFVHSDHCENVFLLNDSKAKSNKIPALNDIFPILTTNPENNFTTDVWQPPKFS